MIAYLLLFLEVLGFASALPFLFSNGQSPLLILAIFAFAQFIGAPLFGELGDRYGMKRSLQCTLLGSLAASIMTVVALSTKLFPLLLVARFCAGFFAATWILCFASTIDTTETKKERNSRVNLLVALIGSAWSIAFLKPVLWLSIAAPALSCLLLIRFKNPLSPDPKCRLLTVLKNKHLKMSYAVIFFWGLGSICTLYWISAFSMHKFETSDATLLHSLLLAGVFWTLSSLLIGRPLSKRVSLWSITLPALFLNSLLIFFTATTDFFLYFKITFIAAFFIAGLVLGSTLSLISTCGKPSQQGRLMGIAGSVIALCQLIALLFIAFAIDTLLYPSALFILVAFVLLLVDLAGRKKYGKSAHKV